MRYMLIVVQLVSVFTTMLTSGVNAQGVDCVQGYSSHDGKPIISINSYTEGSFPVPASNAYECCEACVNEAGCAYSVFSSDNTCNLALIGGSCQDNTVAGLFYTSDSGSAVGVINNGPCGYLADGDNN